MMEAAARNLFFRSLKGISEGALTLHTRGGPMIFGQPGSDLRAEIRVHEERFFRRAVLDGDDGVGEAYVDGDWNSPDLVSVVRLAVRNMRRLESGSRTLSALSRAARLIRHRTRRNTVRGSRRNIAAHYDLGNDFFRLFLDRQMVYSSAVYGGSGDSLEQAQVNKLDMIARKLRLGPDDHVLEIGTGWGAFAIHAAENYGCRITTTTISQAQHDEARERFRDRGLGGRIELLLEDYRNLRGRYDKIVSIEMFEAVGLEYYDAFFGACDRLLAPEGSMLLQTITMNEQHYRAYRRKSDWIKENIFPGSELASVSEIVKSLGRATRLSVTHLADIGIHYARTLEAWRERFLAARGAAREIGFDERFLRMWEYYLAYCEGGFRERYIGDVQMLMTKVPSRKGYSGSPSGPGSGFPRGRFLPKAIPSARCRGSSFCGTGCCAPARAFPRSA